MVRESGLPGALTSDFSKGAPSNKIRGQIHIMITLSLKWEGLPEAGRLSKKGGCFEIKKGSNSLISPCTGLEAVVIGEVHENVTLHCGNISGPRGLVTWYRNDSEPVFLLSSNSSLPPAEPRFSLVNASSLHIEALSLQDEGNYTCQEILNVTQWFQVWLQVASK
ncbi:hypothetical protein P7K49_020391 [Saguinus oedipus]|uniref:Ig-like domain-containing protein n=1 Tax=Saguinus oedipus TaxID=9490 RepID=A0ABQ9V036_SAGOE|nr:hypothetical protein P7K49_020391 [Saguinus oedipus]